MAITWRLCHKICDLGKYPDNAYAVYAPWCFLTLNHNWWTYIIQTSVPEPNNLVPWTNMCSSISKFVVCLETWSTLLCGTTYVISLGLNRPYLITALCHENSDVIWNQFPSQVMFAWKPVEKFLVATGARWASVISMISICFWTSNFRLSLMLVRRVCFPMGAYGAKTLKYTAPLVCSNNAF